MTSSEASCQQGHSWNQSDASRKAGRGCPYCSRKKAWPGETDLFTEVPELKANWDFNKNTHLNPSNLLQGSDKFAWWICGKGHEFEKRIGEMVRSGCSFCANRKILVGFNDLETVRPDLAKELDTRKNDGLSPKDLLFGTSRMVWWKCSKGHSYKAKVSQRNFSNTGCAVCSGKRTESGFNDLVTKYPNIAKTWDHKLNNGLLPQTLSPSSKQKVWWECEKGHSWLMGVAERTKGQGCSVCENRQILAGFNDLLTLAPELAASLAPGLNPDNFATTVGAYSHKKAWWRCPDGHVYEAMVASRHKTECAVCAGQRVLAGFNDLESQNPGASKHFLRDSNQKLPSEVHVASRVHYWWECELGHQFRAHPDSVKRGNWCPYCGNKKVLIGFNDLATVRPDLASEWHPSKNHPLEPKQVINGFHRKVWWLCEAGHAFEQSGKKRRAGQGCPSCAPSGYSPNEPGYLYLLQKPLLELQQFGISNKPKERLSIHKKNGWELLDTVGPADGLWVLETETALKRFFAANRVLLPRDHDDKFDGYTESWRCENIQFRTVAAMLSALREFEDKDIPPPKTYGDT
jgi:hypothetical protein